jgi:hypothetical protein
MDRCYVNAANVGRVIVSERPDRYAFGSTEDVAFDPMQHRMPGRKYMDRMPRADDATRFRASRTNRERALPSAKGRDFIMRPPCSRPGRSVRVLQMNRRDGGQSREIKRRGLKRRQSRGTDAIESTAESTAP